MYIIDYNCIQHTYVETLNLFFEKRCMHKHKTFTTSRTLLSTIQDNIAADSNIKNSPKYIEYKYIKQSHER